MPTDTAATFRAASHHDATGDRLGPLKDLPGFWQGTGFSLIARPDFDSANEDGVFLELNLINETLEFTTIGSPVFNRGSRQEDIALYGVTYLHRVTDAADGSALHIEPGLWLTIPSTTEPPAGETIARLATIPHGNSVCTVGFVQEVVPDGPVEIPPANTVPYAIGAEPPPPGTPNPYRVYDLSADSPYRTRPLADGITQAMIDDPSNVVRDALAGQKLTHITRLITSTESSDEIGNIPFITRNADTVSLESVFAIERVDGPRGDFLQLQYAQTALLQFRGMNFPHVTAGTLVKAF